MSIEMRFRGFWRIPVQVTLNVIKGYQAARWLEKPQPGLAHAAQLLESTALKLHLAFKVQLYS
jgi:hypothetical protein